MTQIVLIGLDVAKHVFHLHAVAADGRVVFRRQVRRSQLTTLLMSIPSCRIAMEACGTAHYWGRQLEELGHEVLLIPPDYVRPFVKRQKNDAADAEAIAEAAQRPDMRFVRVKSEASQAASIVFRGAPEDTASQCDTKPPGGIWLHLPAGCSRFCKDARGHRE